MCLIPPEINGTAPKSTSKDIAVNDKGGNDPALLKHTSSAKKNCLFSTLIQILVMILRLLH